MMQNTISSNGSASWAAHTDDGAQSRNLAAIALAEAMQRARSQYQGETQIAVEPAAIVLTPKQSLDALRQKLKPLYAAIPQDVEGMDLGVVREEKPRLFLDMVAFVDLSEDQKSYRLLQVGRDGQQVLLETADEASLISRITDYIAQRLITRERILEQGDPVVAGAGHFSRGVSAGLAQNQITSEPFLVPPKVQHVEAPVEVATKALQAPLPAPKAVEPAIRIEAVQQAPQPVSNETSSTIAEPRKAFANASRPVQSYAKHAAQNGVQNATSFASTVAAKAHSLNSWWLWPTLAVLLGMGFAAYLLYLYSMSFTS